MAGFTAAPRTSDLKVRIFDGTRQPVAAGVQVLFTIMDGTGKRVYWDYYPAETVFRVPFHDNFGDNYTVVASAGGYTQAGFTPVKCSPEIPQTLDLMLLKKGAEFNFAAARWEALAARDPLLHGILVHGAAGEDAARDRYTQLMETRTAALACLFNITTALTAIQLPAGNPLQYFKELIWDDTMQQDRFYGWADRLLHDQVRLAAAQGLFSREPASAVFHTGATDSYKQIQFGEANVQLTFHGNDTRTVDGVECVKLESDIDYHKDLAAHALLEVVYNGITGSLTDPRQVYVLRWIAGRHAGVPLFDPPYVIA